MALFEKKFCDICGEKIGLLGNNKAANGNICSNCYGKLSPFFRGLKNTTIQSVQQQLVYREQNRQKLNYFSPSKVFGSKTKVYIDETNKCFIVSKRSDYKTENADIIELSQVLNVVANEKEHKQELYTKDSEGRRTSYNPPRYEFTYEITLTITVNTQYFNEIKFEVTDSSNRPQNKSSQEYLQYAQTANQIVAALKGGNAQGANLGGIGNILNTVAGAVGGMNNIGSQQNGGYNQTMDYNAQNLGYNQPNSSYSQQQGVGYNQTPNYNQQNLGYNQPNVGYSQQQGIGYNQTPNYNGQNFGYNQPNSGYAQQQSVGYNQIPNYNGQNAGYNQNTAYGQQNTGYNSYDNNGVNSLGQQNQYGQNQQFGVNGFGQQNINGFSWICPSCGVTNVANFCQNCGRQKS